jgi:hypothetical protein
LRRRTWLVPLRDTIYFAVWVASFFSTRITWGGEEYTMEKGQMVRTDAGSSADARRAAEAPR